MTTPGVSRCFRCFGHVSPAIVRGQLRAPKIQARRSSALVGGGGPTGQATQLSSAQPTPRFRGCSVVGRGVSWRSIRLLIAVFPEEKAKSLLTTHPPAHPHRSNPRNIVSAHLRSHMPHFSAHPGQGPDHFGRGPCAFALPANFSGPASKTAIAERTQEQNQSNNELSALRPCTTHARQQQHCSTRHPAVTVASR